ncbi:tetratricopeptide repeat protein [Amphritea sp.]|uniref:tetratricopeptide repeat protein n=1 Tax=Amphritea sp. TaxID=1872502 RepID=UPI0025C1FF74|nr:tetratricopeptide repeat protein [Amphritea sp.]
MFKSKFRVLFMAVAVTLAGCDSPDEKAQAYVDRAKDFLAEGNYEAAHIEFSNAMQVNPNNIEGLFLLTKVFEKNKEWPKVYRYLQKVLELDPNHIDAIVAIGNLELAGQQLDSAIKRSDKALALAPDSVDVRAFRALLLFKIGDLEGAVAEAQFVLSKEPENVEAIMVLASERLESEDPQGAISFLDGVSKSDDLLLHVMKIKAFNSMKDLDGAVVVFNQLIELEPEKDEYYFALAKQFISFEEFDRAEATLRRLVSQEPKNNQAKLVLVEFISKFNNQEAAIHTLSEFLQAQPENHELGFNLVNRLQQTGEIEQAKALLEEIASKDDSGEMVLKAKNRLAIIAFSEGDLEEGGKYLQQVLAAEPNNAEAVVTESKRLLVENNAEQAISKLRAVLKSSPNSPAVLGLLGRAHEQQGRTELALDQYAKALRADETYRPVVLSYSSLLVKLKRFSQAEDILGRFLAGASSDVDALKMMAQIKLTLKDWEGAHVIAQQLENIEKGAAERIRGAAYLGSKQFQQGVASFEKAYDMAEDKSLPMVTLVRSYVATGKIEAAESFLLSVLSIDSDNYTGKSLLAQLYAFEKKTDLAKSTFESAIEIQPGNVDAYVKLSAFLLGLDRAQDAIAVLQSGLAHLPDNLMLSLNLASIYQASGDLPKAIELYSSILNQHPETDVAANNLAAILSDTDEYLDLDRAKKLAARFRDSEVPYYQDTLGWINYKRGEFNDALYFHENAVKSIPEFAEFRYHLGMSYKAVGDIEKARAELEKAISLSDDDVVWVASAREALKGL